MGGDGPGWAWLQNRLPPTPLFIMVKCTQGEIYTWSCPHQPSPDRRHPQWKPGPHRTLLSLSPAPGHPTRLPAPGTSLGPQGWARIPAGPGGPRKGSPLEPVTVDPHEHNFQAERPRSNFADLHVDKDRILQTADSEDRIHFKLVPLPGPDDRNGAVCGSVGACREPSSETGDGRWGGCSRCPTSPRGSGSEDGASS